MMYLRIFASVTFFLPLTYEVFLFFVSVFYGYSYSQYLFAGTASQG